MTDSLDYPHYIDTAMRGVVREVLRKVSAVGLPGDHHFYISFSTIFPGVKMSETLRAKYPKEITIVMQHQFWDFKVEEHQFSVTLSFGGMPEKLTVPFAALTAFADPSTKFGLQFQQSADAQGMFEGMDEEPFALEQEDESEGSAEVISLDSFRKK